MTIKELAEITGYAVGTVSRALNNHPNVSDEAREKILAAAKEYHFEINLNAKQLKQQTSNVILAIVKGTQNELFSELVEVMQNLIAETKYNLVVDYVDEDLNEVHRGISLCKEKKPRGIMFLGGNTKNFSEDFESIDVPCIMVTGDASSLNFQNLSSVSTDDVEAARSAIEKLISMGHKSFAVIGGDRFVSDTTKHRFAGCMRAFSAHNIPFDPDKDYMGVRYSYNGGYAATKSLLQNGRKFTAIFACADVMAIGAIRALRENGLSVPEDVSVMGVDGLPLGNYLVPRLASVCQSAQKLATRSVEILMSQIEANAPSCHETVPFELRCTESIKVI